jgi:hypothetical protein
VPRPASASAAFRSPVGQLCLARFMALQWRVSGKGSTEGM